MNIAAAAPNITSVVTPPPILGRFVVRVFSDES
jgi:hypothetical protein